METPTNGEKTGRRTKRENWRGLARNLRKSRKIKGNSRKILDNLRKSKKIKERPGKNMKKHKKLENQKIMKIWGNLKKSGPKKK